MSLTKQFKTNQSKEVSGVTIDYGTNADGSTIQFILSRMSRSNVAYTKCLELATRPYRRQIEMKTLDDATATKVFIDVFVKTILKGWNNVLLSDVTGNSDDEGFAPFNESNAIQLMNNLPDLYDDLQEQAKSAQLFKDESLEIEAKN